MTYVLYVLAGWVALGALLIIGGIGKPRKPVSAGHVAVIVAIDAFWVVVLVLAARRLS
jgi:hypothetical protein